MMMMMPRAWSFAGDDKPSCRDVATRSQLPSPRLPLQRDRSFSQQDNKSDRDHPVIASDEERSSRSRTSPKQRCEDRSRERFPILHDYSPRQTYGATTGPSQPLGATPEGAVVDGNSTQSRTENSGAVGGAGEGGKQGNGGGDGHDGAGGGDANGDVRLASPDESGSVGVDVLPSFILLDCSKVTNVRKATVYTGD